MSMKGTLMAVLVTGALMALVLGTPDSTQGETLAVTDVQVSPDPPFLGAKASISCRITDETDVKYVWLFYCSPLACLPPIDMTKGTDGKWAALTYELDSPGEYHFNITVEYNNATRAWTEDHTFTPVDAPPTSLEVEFLSRKSQNVEEGKKVVVYCLPKDAANVTQMWVHVKIDGVPKATWDMTRLDNGTYEGEFGPYDEGNLVAYNVSARMASGAVIYSDDVTFTVGAKSDGDDDGFIPAVGAAATIAILMGLAVSVKRRRRRSA